MQEPKLFNINREESLNPAIEIYKAHLVGTSQDVFIKKGVTDFEIQKIRHNYSVLNSLKEEPIAPAYFLYGPNQDTILMPFYRNISVEFQIHKAMSDLSIEPVLHYNEKFMVAYGVANALKCSHDLHILHLNLKPSNVLLDDRKPKITDFSFKTFFTPEELNAMPISSLLYMAPEIRRGNEASSKADVYSFGLLLHFMYTGKCPIENIQNESQVRNLLLSNQNIQLSFNSGDYDELAEIGELISNCILENPDDRPTFTEIISTLNEILDDVPIPNFDKYKLALKAKSLKFPSHFEQLQIIGDLPNKNNIESYEFDFQKLLSIISHFNNHYICIVFLCGPYQKGKSTIARALTGNNAFFSGDGIKGTTKKILIDPKAYTVSDLRNRLPIEIKQMFNDIIAQNPYNEPVFFFIDSVGGGDQDYVEYLRQIINKTNSILSSISTVCITVNEPNNNDSEAADYLKMIRKGQMLSLNSQIADVILAMRTCPPGITSYVDRKRHNSYLAGTDELKNVWFSSHSMILSQYAKNSLHLMPLGNPNDFPDSYMFSVAEVILKMIESTVRRIKKLQSFHGCNFSVIKEVLVRLNYYLFKDPEYDKNELLVQDELKKMKDNKETNEKIIENICNIISVNCQMMINEKVTIGQVENPDIPKIKKEINKLATDINVIISIYLPMFLADTYFPFNEFYQLMSDLYAQSKDLMTYALPQWIDGATFPKIPQLVKIDKSQVDAGQVISDGVEIGVNAGANATGVAATLGGVGAILGTILLFTPLAPIGATMLTASTVVIAASPIIGAGTGIVGGVTGMAISGVEQNKEIDKEYERKVKQNEEDHKNKEKQQEKLHENIENTIKNLIFYYPLIWKRNEEVIWNEFNWDIFNDKQTTFIHFIRSSDRDVSQILKAFTGSEPTNINVTSQIESSILTNRFAQVGINTKKITSPNITIIYSDFHILSLMLDGRKKTSISNKNMIFVLPIKENEALPHFNKTLKCEFHILLLTNDESYEPYTKNRIETISRGLSQNNKIGKFNTITHPIISKSFNLLNEGPRCNSTIKNAFHSILFKKY